MKKTLIALAFLLPGIANALPTPSYDGITVGSTGVQVNGPATVTGAIKATGGGQLSGTFTGPLSMGPLTPTLTPTTQAGLSGFASYGSGTTVFVTDCANGSQSGGGVTGCPAFLDTGGTWRLLSTPSNLPITIGGQSVNLGGATANVGNGPKIQLATGTSHTAGDALVYDASGNAVDSGVVPSGGTGGGGTVAPGAQGSIAVYLNAGTSSTVGPISIVNNAVIATNGSGFATEVTTLPIGLTIPSATLSSPTMTGTISIGTANYTGKQTFLPSVVSSAGLNIPAGVAPSAPAAGDVWASSVGLFYRAGSTTEGPLIGSVTGTGPIVINGIGTSSVIATCPTCATTTNGGALTGTSPITISAGGAVSLGTILRPAVLLWNASTPVTNDTYPIFKNPLTQTVGISTITYHTNGPGSSGTGSFQAALNTCTAYNTGCTPVPSCNVNVTSATDNTVSCGGGGLPAGQYLDLIITGVTGTPSSAWFQATLAQPSS